MARRYVYIGIAVALIALSFVMRPVLLKGSVDVPGDAQVSPATRIVSMAPSITEVLFALGLGGRVVGVTRYCDYPLEATAIAKIGGFLDPSYEAIVALEPDLVILLSVHEDSKKELERLGIRTREVDHRQVDGILDSIRVIGAACGVDEAGEKLASELDARLEAVRAKTSELERVTVLISAGRGLGSGKVEEAYIAGRHQWHDTVIEAAGGVNAFEDEWIQFPTVTAEGLLRMNPDVIIEMAPEVWKAGLTEDDVIAEWDSIPNLSAVSAGRVHVLTGDYVVIPGPRFVNTVEDLARLLHPEIDWTAP